MVTRRPGGQIGLQAHAESIVFAVWCYQRTWSHREDWQKYLLVAVVRRHQARSAYRFTMESLDGHVPPLVGNVRGPSGSVRKELGEAITEALCAKLECQAEDVRRLSTVVGQFVRGLKGRGSQGRPGP